MAKRRSFTPNDNNYAVAYYRYSSHTQNEASIDQQRHAAQGFAAEHGYTMIREYEDAARSGTNTNRPGYQRMLAELPTLRPAVLIVWKIDRLGRNQQDLVLAEIAINAAGTTIKYIADTIPDEGVAHILTKSIFQAVAQIYSENLSDNVSRGMLDNARQGFTNGHKLLGYKRGASKRYELDPATAPVVQKIFEDYADGVSMKTICDTLNKQGTRTVRGTLFTINSLRTILTNQSYLGIYHYKDIIIPGGMPAIVSQELFDKVQLMLEGNRHKGPGAKALDPDTEAPRYWLSGKLYCGHCDLPLQGVSGTSRNRSIYYYYSCPNNRNHKGCCLRRIPKELIETRVTEVLTRFLNTPDDLRRLIEKIMDDNRRRADNSALIKELETRLAATSKSIDNLVAFIMDGANSEAVRSKLAELEQARTNLTDAIKREKAIAAAYADGSTFENKVAYYLRGMAELNLLNNDVWQEILEFYINRIYVYEDKIVITFWYSDDQTTVPLNEIYDSIPEDDSVYLFESLADGSTNVNRTRSKDRVLLFFNRSLVI